MAAVLDLRPYQSQAIHDLRCSIGQGNRSPLLVLPTGSGKTAVATDVVKSAQAKGSRVVFIANRKQLVIQTSAAFSRAGINHGITMSGRDVNIYAPVQVASEQTLKARASRNRMMPSADLLIVDEAHMSIAPGTRELIESFGNVPRIGLTATPCRGDGRGLGALYDDLIVGPNVGDLTRDGYLAPARYFAGSKTDLSGVKIVRGDYDEKALGARANTPTLVGDVVTNWLRLAKDRKTIVFAVNVAHSMALQHQFASAGISAEHLDGGHDDDERAAVLKRFREGRTQVLCNCMLFTYGFDEPSASCVVLARPTKSIAMYLQTVGRALRPYPGKVDCLVLDHAGSVDELGFVDEPIIWTLDDSKRAEKAPAKADEKPRDPITCPQCKRVFNGGRICPGCGHEIQIVRKSEVEHTEADLLELERDKARKEWPIEAREQFYAELLGYAISKGKNPGSAYHRYKEKFGVYPIWGKTHPPQQPSPETLRWIKSRNIAFSKRKAA